MAQNELRGAFMCDDCYYRDIYEINKKNRDISSY